MAKKIDTVTVEVVRNLLMSIAEETYGIIVRSAYSTNMKERRDVCTRTATAWPRWKAWPPCWAVC